MRTGIANLPLHYGKAPHWLFERMIKLAREITIYIVSEFGSDQFIARLAHPVWFQSLGCVLGFDWHSSGITTTTCGALKEAVRGLENDLGLFICGGKGAVSRKTPIEISGYTHHFNYLNNKTQSLIHASKISAKVDNTALQDGFQLYHHTFFFTRKANWTVIQQGMNTQTHYARRYHWYSGTVSNFVEEPHSAICCDQKTQPLNLVAKQSRSTRVITTALAKEKPIKLLKNWRALVLLDLPPRHQIFADDLNPQYLSKVLLQTYQKQPENFESLLSTNGLGPKSLRALTLLAEVLAGARPSYEDPVRYAFAHGGKDGIPYPVDRQIYDQSIEILHQAIRYAKISPFEKNRAYQRLYSQLNQ
jgi:hypothetical protein